jgi:hypothetical protein
MPSFSFADWYGAAAEPSTMLLSAGWPSQISAAALDEYADGFGSLEPPLDRSKPRRRRKSSQRAFRQGMQHAIMPRNISMTLSRR